jgi:hypothetical protein
MKRYTGKDVAAVLLAAREKLNSRGKHWTKGRFRKTTKDGVTQYCSLGAIRAVTRSPTLRQRAEAALVAATGEQVIHWNDHADREWRDVNAAFRKAAKLAEKENL